VIVAPTTAVAVSGAVSIRRALKVDAKLSMSPHQHNSTCQYSHTPDMQQIPGKLVANRTANAPDTAILE
jgi:hypothetical protein